MDLISTQCTLFKRVPKKIDLSFLETRPFGMITPIQYKRKDNQTHSPRWKRHHTQCERRFEDKGVNCDLFENLQINKTFQCNGPQFDSQQPKLFIPEIRVLRKKPNGLTVFKPIPRDQGQRTLCHSPNREQLDKFSLRKKRDSKQLKMLELEIMKSSMDKEKWFSDRKCRVFLNDLWCDSYRQ